MAESERSNCKNLEPSALWQVVMCSWVTGSDVQLGDSDVQLGDR